MLMAMNIELFCCGRLLSEGLETPNPRARLDAYRGWRMGAGPGTNSDGLRGPPVPSGDTQNLRILMLGGSVTNGLDVDDASPYPRQAEAMLQETDPSMEVVNGGVCLFSSFEMLRLLMELEPRVRPRLITVMCGLNEFQASSYRQFEPTAANGVFSSRYLSDGVRQVLLKSATFRYLESRLLSRALPLPLQVQEMRYFQGPPDSIRNSLDNLSIMKCFADARGMKMVIVEEAHRDNTLPEKEAGPGLLSPRNVLIPYAQRLRDEHAHLAQNLHVPFLDMHEVLAASNYAEDDLFLKDDPIHLTQLGHRIVARALADFLRREGLVR